MTSLLHTYLSDHIKTSSVPLLSSSALLLIWHSPLLAHGERIKFCDVLVSPVELGLNRWMMHFNRILSLVIQTTFCLVVHLVSTAKKPTYSCWYLTYLWVKVHFSTQLALLPMVCLPSEACSLWTQISLLHSYCRPYLLFTKVPLALLPLPSNKDCQAVAAATISAVALKQCLYRHVFFTTASTVSWFLTSRLFFVGLF
jgi:hypothetical protein